MYLDSQEAQASDPSLKKRTLGLKPAGFERDAKTRELRTLQEHGWDTHEGTAENSKGPLLCSLERILRDAGDFGRPCAGPPVHSGTGGDVRQGMATHLAISSLLGWSFIAWPTAPIPEKTEY